MADFLTLAMRVNAYLESKQNVLDVESKFDEFNGHLSLAKTNLNLYQKNGEESYKEKYVGEIKKALATIDEIQAYVKDLTPEDFKRGGKAKKLADQTLKGLDHYNRWVRSGARVISKTPLRVVTPPGTSLVIRSAGAVASKGAEALEDNLKETDFNSFKSWTTKVLNDMESELKKALSLQIKINGSNVSGSDLILK